MVKTDESLLEEIATLQKRLVAMNQAASELTEKYHTARSSCNYWKEEARVLRIAAARYSKQLREAGLALDNLSET